MSKDFRVRKEDRLDWEEYKSHSGKKHAGHDRRASNKGRHDRLSMRKHKELQQTTDFNY